MKVKDADEMGKQIEQERETAALNDYDGYLKKVVQMKEMTDTPAWKGLFRSWQRDKLETANAILTEDKTRDMIICQERIKAVNRLVESVELPVLNLQEFCNGMPLFAGNFKTRAAFNKDTGTIELRTAE